MDAKEFVIVIGRQFGSGGRELGQQLAQRLGIPFFDRRLLAEAAVNMGFEPEIFMRSDECRPSFFRSMLSLNYGSSSAATLSSPMSTERIYQATTAAIRSIAEKPCVIVGRTADYILRDLENMASIFVYADLEDRARRIVERGESPGMREACDLARRRDRLREDYYNYFTGRQWGHLDNYELALNTSMLTLEDCVTLLESYLAMRGRK